MSTIKLRRAKLYIPVLNEKQRLYNEVSKQMKATLLNANKIPILRDIIPFEEALITHLQIQRIKLEKDKNYKPKPFVVTVEKSIFTGILNEMKKKNNNVEKSGHIALFGQYPGIPVCFIVPEIRNKKFLKNGE